MAQPIETHYDQLQVMRTAPLEVIKASYRVLSQKYHPDRNTDPDALRIMKLVNQAWDVLSDPDRRAKHDRWIADIEQKSAPPGAHAPSVHDKADARDATAPQARNAPADAGLPLSEAFKKYALRLAALIVVGLALIFAAVQIMKSIGSRDTDPSSFEKEAPFDSRATTADIGGAQPSTSKPVSGEALMDRLPHGYVKADRQDPPAGAASIEIDNTAGKRDVHVRLYRNGRQVRSIFVHQGRLFMIDQLVPGMYVIRYRVSIDGQLHVYQVSGVFDHQQNVPQTDASGSGNANRLRAVLSSEKEDENLSEAVPIDQF